MLRRPRAAVSALAPPLIALALLVPCARPAAADRRSEAESLYRRALDHDAQNTIESRRQAMHDLERATMLAPDHAEYELALARLYYRMGFLKQSRVRFQRVQQLDPRDADARMGLGWVWRRDWLKYLELPSLLRAIDNFSAAATIHPRDPQPWLQLVPLLIEANRLEQAQQAADHAYEADRALPDAVLAVATTAYRRGQVARADSAFRNVLPRLPRVVRERFDDIAPVSDEADTAAWRRLSPSQRVEFERRFWKEHDPDLSTTLNEAQLEYWSRVTQAYFLFFDPRRREWDQRGEIYVRYGPPRLKDYNPIGSRTRFQMSAHGYYPMNALVWTYPELGMTVVMQDRTLNEFYLKEHSLLYDTDPVPSADSLAMLEGDKLAFRGGRGVFPRLPPGVQPLPGVDGVLARFAGDAGPRLMGLLQAPGSPSDTLTADWVVLDTAQVEVARTRSTLAPSACDPAELRVADFISDLPPGHYAAGLTVTDARGRRGVFRQEIELDAPQPVLQLSDVVVSCAGPGVEPGTGDQPPSVRLQANPGSRVSDPGPLTVYFEAYHLQRDASGLARLEFEYVVRSADRDPRIWIQRVLQPRPSVPEVSATRRDEQPGDLRRQFVTVPVRSLPPGRYRLEIKVRDLNAGIERSTSTVFRKLGQAAGS